MYNQSGQIIHQSLLKVSKGINFSSLDVSQLNSGIYIFEMSIDGNKNRKKFIKL
ncbi:MAG: T9SS type A sorting domain-containing protein [Saprospiraceae bacterium]|nr:T9SS type A sorting domain-containing protein [Saprospiraceae bacterium]